MVAEFVDVFISCALADEAHRRELEKHLTVLQRKGAFRAWHVGLVGAGHETDVETLAAVARARLIVLLVSAEYLAAHWDEMEQALHRHHQAKAQLIPIIVEACDWEYAPFGTLKVLPSDRRPVTSWPNRNEAWADVAKGIRLNLEQLAGILNDPQVSSTTRTGTPSGRMRWEERIGIVRKYVRERWDPSDLPDAFWNEPECPPFVPPLGVFRTWMGEVHYKCGQPYGRWIGQSAGWMPDDGREPIYMEETARDAIVAGWFEDTVPPGHAQNNMNYDMAKAAWEAEWRHRRRR